MTIAQSITPPPLPGSASADAAAVRGADWPAALPPRLFNLAQLDCLYDPAIETLWTFISPTGRPSFNPAMLADFTAWQDDIAASFGPGRVPLKYLVLGSRVPGVFCYGGDLDLFAALIRAGDRPGLIRYGRHCVEILHRNLASLDLPIITVGLVEGDALGGGWEALMSFNLIVAERGARFGLPEISFNLFPGMGAHALLSRKVGAAMAERLIRSGEPWSAEQLYDLGLVHHLADPGDGAVAVRALINRERRRHAGHVGANRAMRLVNPVTLDELVAIVTEWADTALKLGESDLRFMLKLVARQSRKGGQAAAA